MSTMWVRRAMTVVVAMIAVAALAGCGGDDSDKADNTTTTEDPSLRGEGAGEFCALVRTFGTQLTGIVSSGNDTEQIRQFAEDVEPAIKEAEETAPEEIKPDVTMVARAAERYLAALKDAGYDLTKVPPEATQAFQAPDVTAAAVRVQGYAASVCGTRS